MSASLQILFIASGSTDVLEVSQSLAYREARNIDYTPVHLQDEIAAYADPGFAVVERVWNRTVMVLGDEFPKRRIGRPPHPGPADLFRKAIAGAQDELDTNVARFTSVQASGWNIVSNTSRVTDHWIGDPGEEQLKLSLLVEEVVERLNISPSRGGTGATGPITRTS